MDAQFDDDIDIEKEKEKEEESERDESKGRVTFERRTTFESESEKVTPNVTPNVTPIPKRRIAYPKKFLKGLTISQMILGSSKGVSESLA